MARRAMSAYDAEVIVVGGGPAGAATAWMLARGGRHVLLLDRAAFPRPKPCAEYISPEACRILDDMGVMPTVERAGAARLTGMRVRAPDGSELLGEFGAARGLIGSRVLGVALRRERFDMLVLDVARSAGVRVRERMHVRDLVRDNADRVSGVRLADGGTLTARIVIGADGLRSVVARRLGLGRHARRPRRMAFVTHYANVAGVGLHGEMHVERDGYVGLARVDGDLVNVAVVVPAVHARDAAGYPAQFVDGWVRRRAQLAHRFAGATRVTPVATTGPFAWETTRAWAPGAALVGDAADFFDPFTGEGIYAALRGAELLTPYVHAVCAARSARDEVEALSAYDRCRRDAFRGKWRLEKLVGLAVGWPAFMNRAARGLARRRDLADTFVGVTGDVVPASEVLRPGYVLALAHAALR
ncbi:MAG TPA: FAD-dependent monooxygenase [Gemmatimonadaceae bacterium]|nr:FAD-dependent monooxygenase [Gemmatimonadaceae bacterium]